MRTQIVMALLLWCYIIYRAFFISITQDETHTYLLVKTYNWKQALGTTNTHWLNSLFIRLFLYLPGEDHLWKIRMFPVLCWIVYSFSTIRLSSYFKNKWIGFVFFAVTILNPFLIFYFSIARGYAPACAFIMLSLWLATKCIRTNEVTPQKWFYVFLAAAIATIANFAAFYFFIGLTGAFLLQLLINRKLNLVFHSSSKRWIVLVCGTSVVSAGALFLVSVINELFFPGNSNIINSLFGSLIKCISYFDYDPTSYYNGGVSYLMNQEVVPEYQAIGFVIAFLLVSATLYSAYSFRLSKRLTLSSLALFSCIGIILFNMGFHFFFKTPYLFERTTLILYPPLVIGLFFFIDEIIQHSRLLRVVNILSAFLLIPLCYNFYRSISLNSFLDWPIQVNTKECLDYLQSSNAKMVGMNIWHYNAFINYYSKAYPDKYGFNYQVISDKAQMDSLNSSLQLKFDYLLIAPPYNDTALLKNWNVKLSFPESRAKILKNKSVNF